MTLVLTAAQKRRRRLQFWDAGFDPNEPRDEKGRWSGDERYQKIYAEARRKYGKDPNEGVDQIARSEAEYRFKQRLEREKHPEAQNALDLSLAKPVRSTYDDPRFKKFYERAYKRHYDRGETPGVAATNATDEAERKMAKILLVENATSGMPKDVAFYHGTAEDLEASILQNGLVPKAGKGADSWAKRNGWTVQQTSGKGRDASVYFAASPDKAEQYANLLAEDHHCKGVVLKIAVPPDEVDHFLDKVKADEASDVGAWRYEGKIPPEWISVVKKVDGTGARVTVDADEGLVFYAVVLAKPDAAPLQDAPPSRDPSGTADLKARMWRETKLRWRKAEDGLRKALGPGDMLFAGTVQQPLASRADRLQAFGVWLDEWLRHCLIGTWTNAYVEEAALRANKRAVGLGGVASTDPVGVLRQVAQGELQGIVDAVAQQVMRVVAQMMLAHAQPNAIARAAAEKLMLVGQQRSKMWVEYVIMKTFGSQTLACFRAAGMTHVGLTPEHVCNDHGLVYDAARKTVQRRHKKTGRFIAYTKPLSKTRQIKVLRAERKLQKAAEAWGGEMDVMTAMDDLVCRKCNDIAEDGPYSLEEAESLIPAHPNCRCVYVPAS